MVCFDTLRHFVQEWIRIQHPKDKDRAWPWMKNYPLWFLNLYAVPGDEVQKEMRSPFISILIDGCTDPSFGLTTSDTHCYSHYFTDDDGKCSFQYPRRYILDPFGTGRCNRHLGRFEFHSNHYKEENHKFDMALERHLVQSWNYRHSVYDSVAYGLLIKRLNEMEDAAASETGIRVPIQYAENLIDTTISAKIAADGAPASPDTMLLQAPVSGIIPQIKKSNVYRIINGSLVLANEPVIASLVWESSYPEYQKLAQPFRTKAKTYSETATNQNMCKAVVYLAVECPSDTFYFNESFSNILFKGKQSPDDGTPKSMVYMVSHHFSLIPSSVDPRASFVYPKLTHTIIESAIPNDKRHQRFIQKENAILFKRSDMPPGFHKHRGGNSVSVNLPIT